MQEKILIVDSDEGIFKYLNIRLANHGYLIKYLPGSLDAIELLKQESFDLAIVEIDMPEINGVTLLKRFKEMDPCIEVLMMGTPGNAWQAMSALKFKAADFLQKPFGDFSDIYKAIERALKEKRLATENKALLKKLEESNRQLSLRVQEKTQELENFNFMMLEYTEELTSVIQGIAVLQMNTGIEQLLGKIVEGLKKNFKVEKVALFLCDSSSNSIILGSSINVELQGIGLFAKSCLDPVQKVIQTGRPLDSSEYAGECKTCDEIFGEWVINPMKARNEVLGVIIASVPNREKLDIIRVYINTVTLALSNSILYEEVQKGAKELKAKKEELEKTNIRLQELDSVKTSFMNMVVHDLRTPLTSIKAYTDLILRYKDKPQETKDKFVRIIKSECARLESLVNNFLNIEKIESGHMDFNFSPANLKEIIGHFISVYKVNTDAKKINLYLDFDENLPLVNIDKESIEQVIINLLGNATKFTPEGGEIVISARRLDDFMEVSFSDTGPGVPSGLQAAIFDKFTQAHKKKVPGGTGLGLHIAKNIIKAHGGEIGVEPREEKGARFYFTVKVIKED